MKIVMNKSGTSRQTKVRYLERIFLEIEGLGAQNKEPQRTFLPLAQTPKEINPNLSFIIIRYTFNVFENRISYSSFKISHSFVYIIYFLATKYNYIQKVVLQVSNASFY